MNIVGQDKMPLEEAVAHYGTKGMKWGVTKQNRTSLANIGDRLNKKKAPLTRAYIRNYAAGSAAQVALLGASAVATTLLGPAAPAAAPIFVAAYGGAITAGAAASTVMLRDFGAVVASRHRKNLTAFRGKKRPAPKKK